jgi:adenine deaminase
MERKTKMRPEKLREEVEKTVKQAQARITSDGAKYYDPEKETYRFEHMTLDQLLQYAQEEVLDEINYGVMINIRLGTLRDYLARAAGGITSHANMVDLTSEDPFRINQNIQADESSRISGVSQSVEGFGFTEKK